MLSRIAESLYWIGRYVERAEDTARILDVHLHRTLADPWIDEEAACRSLLTVMGVASSDQPVSAARVVGHPRWLPVRLRGTAARPPVRARRPHRGG